jgi:YVTN family beta-propeller protein
MLRLLSGWRAGAGNRRSAIVAVGAAGGTAVALAAAAIALAAIHPGARPRHGADNTQLASSACHGPRGAAYVSDTGDAGFSAIDTKNCVIVQTYDVDDTAIPGGDGDVNYSATNEGVATYGGGKLYFADAGTSTVAVIVTKKLNPANYYNPAEKLIRVGMDPQDLAVTPDGKQLWVADTGPQTAAASPSGLTVVSTSTDKVIATLPLRGDPAKIAFSPSGTRAYVTTSEGLWVYDTATRKAVGEVRGLGHPHGVAVSPNGKAVYVTNTVHGLLDVISTRTDRVTATVKVGELPWQVIASAHGNTVYVANPDSDSVSVIATSTNRVRKIIRLRGGPDTLGLTPNGSELWVGQSTAGWVTVLDTSNDAVVGTINLGDEGPQSGDGYEPTSIILVTTPTPGSGQAAVKPATRTRTGSGQ